MLRRCHAARAPSSRRSRSSPLAPTENGSRTARSVAGASYARSGPVEQWRWHLRLRRGARAYRAMQRAFHVGRRKALSPVRRRPCQAELSRAASGGHRTHRPPGTQSRPPRCDRLVGSRPAACIAHTVEQDAIFEHVDYLRHRLPRWRACKPDSAISARARSCPALPREAHPIMNRCRTSAISSR